MAYLVLVRHGISEYNKKGLWAGLIDVPLIDEGRLEAKTTAEALKDIHFDVSFTSVLKRAKETLEIIKKEIGQPNLLTIETPALNERNYGDFAGKNKWEVKHQLGDEEFHKLRRSWDYPVPNGESLKQVYERVVPYFITTILPYLKAKKNVIISSSGNTFRALIKYLENISDEEIGNLEIGTGEAYVYQLDESGNITRKEIRAANPNRVSLDKLEPSSYTPLMLKKEIFTLIDYHAKKGNTDQVKKVVQILRAYDESGVEDRPVETRKKVPYVFKDGPLEHHAEKRLVIVSGKRFHLTFIENLLLLALTETPNIPVVRNDSTKKIWGEIGQDGKKLDALVGRLRDKLRIDGNKHEFIETIIGIGHRYVPISELDEISIQGERPNYLFNLPFSKDVYPSTDRT